MENPVLYQEEGNIAIITLNRPERHNSFTQLLLAQLYDAIEKVDQTPGIRAAIITGNGKSFCSGIDLQVIGKENLFNPRGDGKELPDIMGACDKPIIGAVNGAAVTGGFELALNCDILIASENAKFGDTHAKVGIHPGWGMTQLLQQKIGQQRAKFMSLTCQYIDARRALEWGLVTEVVPAENLMTRAREVASLIGATNPDLMKKIKMLIEYRNSHSLDDSSKFERAEFRKFVEAAQALFNKA
ncbi:MAG: enoyl-CoA hydratase [Spirochaetae bacterium HGW-Spirochaetae-1]|jgi:enoyl-CoA hydratase|nr:MAG: enoyl-CoA hydratase [Spirochaetae bacterium HGW-Spirochaetae-1]